VLVLVGFRVCGAVERSGSVRLGRFEREKPTESQVRSIDLPMRYVYSSGLIVSKLNWTGLEVRRTKFKVMTFITFESSFYAQTQPTERSTAGGKLSGAESLNLQGRLNTLGPYDSLYMQLPYRA
jgi:hypothetical protein